MGCRWVLQGQGVGEGNRMDCPCSDHKKPSPRSQGMIVPLPSHVSAHPHNSVAPCWRSKGRTLTASEAASKKHLLNGQIQP